MNGQFAMQEAHERETALFVEALRWRADMDASIAQLNEQVQDMEQMLHQQAQEIRQLKQDRKDNEHGTDQPT